MITVLSKQNIAENIKYGSVIHDLSIAKMNNYPIITTIIIPIDYFQEYLDKMIIKDTIIKELLHILSYNNIKDGQELYISNSYYQNNNPLMNSGFKSRNNFASLKNTLTRLYEIWSSEGAQIYRISHKVNTEQSYPAIYIQPFISRIYSLVTHNPATGDITNASNFDEIIHNNINKFDERHKAIINNVDNCFIQPKKIYFYENNNEFIVLKVSDYLMTNQALFSYLISKHRQLKITSSNFLMQIQIENIVDYIGYGIISDEKYPADLPLSLGLTSGKVIFTSTNIESLQKFNTSDTYILLLNRDVRPEKIVNIIDQCAGVITNNGGMTSHTAVITRGLRKPAILVKQMIIDASRRQARYYNTIINEFDYIAISSRDELCWALSGELSPIYKTQNITQEQVDYFLKIVNEYRMMDKFKEQDIDFQLYYAKIINVIKKVGLNIESSFY